MVQQAMAHMKPTAELRYPEAPFPGRPPVRRAEFLLPRFLRRQALPHDQLNRAPTFASREQLVAEERIEDVTIVAPCERLLGATFPNFVRLESLLCRTKRFSALAARAVEATLTITDRPFPR
jgi:hypothetical protein